MSDGQTTTDSDDKSATARRAGMERSLSDSLRVITAAPADHAAIAAILEDVQRWLANRGIDQWTTPFTDAWIAQSIATGELHIARLHGEPVAVIRLLWADPLFWGNLDRGDAAYIHTMAVRRGHAGCGIGERLVGWAGEQASARGRRFLRLDCREDNPSLGAYYQRLGFTPRGSARVGGTIVTLLEKKRSA
jgi:GNAT superfamily N-acetyltransferase